MSHGSSFASDARVVALLADLVAELRELRAIVESQLASLAAQSNGRVDAVDEPTNEPERLMTQREVADLLRVNPRTLRELVQAGEAPPSITVGSRPRWRQRDVQNWLDERRAP